MPLLTRDSAKIRSGAPKTLTRETRKLLRGAGRGVLGAVLFLTPGGKLCPFRSPGCTDACVSTSGRLRLTASRNAQRRRSRQLRRSPGAFLNTLRRELKSLERSAERKGLVPAMRLDGGSDLGLAARLAPEFPRVQFYDYTKSPERMLAWLRDTERGLRANEWLTFSRSEQNDADCTRVLERGGNVAVVFEGPELPSTWRGRPVIDGDPHDWRWLDAVHGPAVIVGLRAKGRGKHDRTGFVIRGEATA